MMYCVQGKGTFTVGDEKMEADEKTCILCEPNDNRLAAARVKSS